MHTEKQYQETFESFMSELDANNDVVHTIRDRIMKLEEDTQQHHSDEKSTSHSYDRNY